MGIDYRGSMIVGAQPEDMEDFFDTIRDKADLEDGITEYLWDKCKMDCVSPYYDCDEEEQIFGFFVPDVLIDEMGDEWLEDIRGKAAKFREITGVSASLIGSQDIT